MKDIYLDQDRYDAAVKAILAAICRDEPFTGYDENEIKIALGEKSDIGPESVLSDVIDSKVVEVHGDRRRS